MQLVFSVIKIVFYALLCVKIKVFSSIITLLQQTLIFTRMYLKSVNAKFSSQSSKILFLET